MITNYIYNLFNEALEYKHYQVISELLRYNKCKNYVEVGIYKGQTLFYLARKNKNVKLHGIDPFKSFKDYTDSYEFTLQTNNDYKAIKVSVLSLANLYKNVKIHVTNSIEACKKFKDESLDFVYIDASHEYDDVSTDIKIWLPKVKPGGLLCGHDFCLKHMSVIKAVGDLLGYDNVEVKTDCYVWIYRKPK